MTLTAKNEDIIIHESDDSYRVSTLMGDDMLVLHFSETSFREIPVGCTCVYNRRTYTLFQPAQIKKNNNRNFEYTLTLFTDAYILKLRMMRCMYDGENTSLLDGRLSFDLTATPLEHLQMLVANLNYGLLDSDALWSVGEYPDSEHGTEKTITYHYTPLNDALALMAETFDTEWDVDDVRKKVSLAKLELNRDHPLEMSYGKGNGFRSGAGRSNERTKPPIGRLYVQGGERNIDPSKYGRLEQLASDGSGTILYTGAGSRTLMLPKDGRIWYDGYHFWLDDDSERPTDALCYAVSSDRRSITLLEDRDKIGLVEDAFDGSDVYPQRVGVVSKVVANNAKKNLWDIYDDSDDFPSDFEKLGIAGETPTIIFQGGNLAGREFDLNSTASRIVTEHTDDGWRLEIVPAELDGVWMPGGTTPDDADDDYAGDATWLPKEGDKYVVFGIQLPNSYVLDAEWELFQQAVKVLYEQAKETYTFVGEVDGLWAKSNWDTVGRYMEVGQHVLFADDFMPDGILLRITGIKQTLSNPHAPQLTLSNAIIRTGLGSTIRRMQRNESNRWVRTQARQEALRVNLRLAGMLNNGLDEVNHRYTQLRQGMNASMDEAADILQRIADRLVVNEKRFVNLNNAIADYNARRTIGIGFEVCINTSDFPERIQQELAVCPSGEFFDVELTAISDE